MVKYCYVFEDLAMNFNEAVKYCLFVKYYDFSGRASRSEFWWFNLFSGALINLGNLIINNLSLPRIIIFVILFIELLTIIPAFAVTVRRLHDTDRSGWFYFIALIPIIGILVLLYFWATKGTPGPNRFGPDPLSPNPVSPNPVKIEKTDV